MIAGVAARITTRGAPGNYEDSKQDALLWLLEGRFSYDPTKTKQEIRAYLITRIVGQLVRNWQNEHGTRLKNAPSFVSVSSLQLVYEDEPFYISEEREKNNRKQWAIIEEVLNALNPLKRSIIEKYLSGISNKDIARQQGLTRGRISQIVGEFKEKCREQENAPPTLDRSNVEAVFPLQGGGEGESTQRRNLRRDHEEPERARDTQPSLFDFIKQ